MGSRRLSRAPAPLAFPRSLGPLGIGEPGTPTARPTMGQTHPSFGKRRRQGGGDENLHGNPLIYQDRFPANLGVSTNYLAAPGFAGHEAPRAREGRRVR